MSVRRLAPAEDQPASFSFTEENERWIEKQIAKYPDGRQASAVIPMLWQAQKQHDGWLPQRAIEAVAARLGMPVIRVLEVATFYTMFNLEPVGRWFIQLCGTVPCHVKGSLDLKQVLLERIGDQQHVTADGNFSWLEVECLGACCNAPMLQINDDYYEDLTPDLLIKLLDDLAAGREVKPGPQNGRHASEPHDAVKTLQDPALFDGSLVGSWRKRFEQQDVKTPDEAKAAGEVVPPKAPEPAPAAAPTPQTEKQAATATGPNDPKPGRPDAGRPEHSAAADAPAQRAKSGEEPVAAAKQADASDASSKEGSETTGEPVPAPQSEKSEEPTPSRPSEGKPAAAADEPEASKAPRGRSKETE
ncbi:NADH-quinone oxidoreductase subunit NuoE [Enterovirga rhinocerotis]|uniref:NADH dehydrogenase subunit E n=1 Tax=Enterovirga rhinocerotis TaxID=1339210 RepID=A0A4R7CA34_9HYPH|nr:NADH-quinone oxidoreductase subunit NuoE [Enterovirga rhinocerotis]TDR94225.1 NADH dehydrogenase subunit E [Enterovirga rhinocerotis]